MKKKRDGSGKFLWFLFFVVILAAGIYFRHEVVSQVNAYSKKALSAFAPKNAGHISDRPAKSQAASSAKEKFTFFPDGRTQWSWSVKYPDGRVFKLSEEFSSDCSPAFRPAKASGTIRLEFEEQGSCNPSARKPVQVDAGSLKDTDGKGSPEVIATILTGGNTYGHTSSLIALAPKGPKLVRRLD